MFHNKKFKRIVYSTVLKELPGFWGHERRRQLLKLIKKKQTQGACVQTDKRLGERGEAPRSRQCDLGPEGHTGVFSCRQGCLGTSGDACAKHKHDVWGPWIGPRRLEGRGRGLGRKAHTKDSGLILAWMWHTQVLCSTKRSQTIMIWEGKKKNGGAQNKAAAMQAERGDGPKSYMEETPIHVGPILICLPKTPWWAWGWTLLHPTCPLISIVGEHEIPRHRQGLTEDHHLGTTGFRWSP